MADNGMKTLSRYFLRILFGSKLFYGLLIYLILVLLVVFLPNRVEGINLSEGELINSINTSYIFGLLPCTLIICSVFAGGLFRNKALETCIFSGFPRKSIWLAMNFTCVIGVAIILLVYYSITIIINIPQGLDIDPLRLLLACVIVYTTGSFCTLITLITKSPIKSLIVSFVTINVTGFFALLSVNIFKNGYLANYFTVMAFANALAAKDFIENYAVTFLIYLLFGILFLLLGVKYFMECDIWK